MPLLRRQTSQSDFSSGSSQIIGKPFYVNLWHFFTKWAQTLPTNGGQGLPTLCKSA
jgi:hypothetical protein